MKPSPYTKWSDQRGFTLIETMTASIIAVIAVLGLAFTFSVGRGMVDRFASARDGLAAAEETMERLSILGLRSPTHPDLEALSPPGKLHGPFPRPLNGNPTGKVQWTVTWVDDSANNGTGFSTTKDYKLVTVEVLWVSGTVQDRIQLSRIILGS